MITPSEMKQLEDDAEKKGTSKLVLMERAGEGIASIIKKRLGSSKRILVVCHHGNNGGDGFTAARYLEDLFSVEVLFIGEEDKLKYEAKVNYEKIKNDKKIELLDLKKLGKKRLDGFFDTDIILDCILGMGVSGKMREPISSMIDLINSSKAYKVAIDIPTGLNPDTGEVLDKCVNADLIITMHDLKPGLVKLRDKVEIVDIGL